MSWPIPQTYINTHMIMWTDIHVHIHIYILTYACTHIYKYTQVPYINTYTSEIQTYTHYTLIYTNALTYTYTQTT